MIFIKSTMDAPDSKHRYAWGILLVLGANLLFSVVDTATKWLLASGLFAIQLAFMRYAVHFAITAVERGFRGKPTAGLPNKLRALVVLRSFCLVSATLANFVALGHLTLAVSSALLYTSPLFVCVFAHLILGEKIGTPHLVSILAGLAGALIILWPFGEPLNWYAVLMFYPAMALAMYQVLSRKLSTQVTPGTLQFYTGALGTAALFPFAILFWQMPSDKSEWALLVAIGAFAWAGHEALTRAHAHAQASSLAPFGYSFVVYLTIAGVIVFSDIPTGWTVLGAAIIIVGGLYIWIADHGLKKIGAP